MKKELSRPYYAENDYKYFAGPKGRVIAARIKAYKRHIAFLYGCIGVLMVAGGLLSAYICRLINGGV